MDISLSQKTTIKISFNLLLYVFITLSIPFLLITVSIRVVMTPLFLSFEYNRADFPPDLYGFTREDRLQYAPIALDYLINRESIRYLEELRLPINLCWDVANATDVDCPMYNARELRHMSDVQNITNIIFTTSFIVSLIWIGIIGSAWYFIDKRYIVFNGLRYGAILTLALIATIAVIAIGAWDTFFTGFHQLFFMEGTWRFAYSDTLIRLFPERFWFDASIAVGLLTVLSASIILIGVYRRNS